MNNNYTTVKKLYYGSDLVNIAVGGAEAQVPSALTTWSVNEWGNPTSVVVKEGETSIPNGWQRYNEILSACTLPNTITNIGKNAFHYASNQTDGLIINLPSSLTVIGSTAFQNAKIGCDITIPSGATANGTSAVTSPTCESSFQSTDFTNHIVTIEEGATIIPYHMFISAKNCTVIVPSTVTFLSPKCFQVGYSTNLTVKFLGSTPPDASSWSYSNSNCPFYSSSSDYLNNLTILVPSSKVTTYKNKFGALIGARVQGY